MGVDAVLAGLPEERVVRRTGRRKQRNERASVGKGGFVSNGRSYRCRDLIQLLLLLFAYLAPPAMWHVSCYERGLGMQRGCWHGRVIGMTCVIGGVTLGHSLDASCLRSYRLNPYSVPNLTASTIMIPAWALESEAATSRLFKVPC